MVLAFRWLCGCVLLSLCDCAISFFVFLWLCVCAFVCLCGFLGCVVVCCCGCCCFCGCAGVYLCLCLRVCRQQLLPSPGLASACVCALSKRCTEMREHNLQWIVAIFTESFAMIVIAICSPWLQLIGYSCRCPPTEPHRGNWRTVMGCTSSNLNQVQADEASQLGATSLQVVDAGVQQTHCSVAFKESAMSFHSMDCDKPFAYAPPLACTHRHYMARLNHFLGRIKANKSGLQEEVKHRRSMLCMR